MILCFWLCSNIPLAVVWREHLLKALQKFQKIEDDATLSTLCELSFLGQAMLSARIRTWNTQGHFLFVDWDLFFCFFVFFTSDIHSVGLEAFGLWPHFYISTSICHHSGFKINPMNLKEMEEWAFRLKLREPFYTCRWRRGVGRESKCSLVWGLQADNMWLPSLMWLCTESVWVGNLLYFPPAFVQEWDFN